MEADAGDSSVAWLPGSAHCTVPQSSPLSSQPCGHLLQLQGRPGGHSRVLSPCSVCLAREALSPGPGVPGTPSLPSPMAALRLSLLSSVNVELSVAALGQASGLEWCATQPPCPAPSQINGDEGQSPRGMKAGSATGQVS